MEDTHILDSETQEADWKLLNRWFIVIVVLLDVGILIMGVMVQSSENNGTPNQANLAALLAGVFFGYHMFPALLASIGALIPFKNRSYKTKFLRLFLLLDMLVQALLFLVLAVAFRLAFLVPA